jgi:hypothetical protein
MNTNNKNKKIRELAATGMNMRQIEKETGYDYTTIRGEMLRKKLTVHKQNPRNDRYPLDCFNPYAVICWITGFGQ